MLSKFLNAAILLAGATFVSSAPQMMADDIIADDGITWNIFVDYSRCPNPQRLNPRLTDNESGAVIQFASDSTTNERRFALSAPFSGTLSLFDSTIAPSDDPQSLLIDLFTRAGTSVTNTVWGTASFHRGFAVRPMGEVTWGRKSKEQASLRPSKGSVGTIATEDFPDNLFVYYCYAPDRVE